MISLCRVHYRCRAQPHSTSPSGRSTMCSHVWLVLATHDGLLLMSVVSLSVHEFMHMKITIMMLGVCTHRVRGPQHCHSSASTLPPVGPLRIRSHGTG